MNRAFDKLSEEEQLKLIKEAFVDLCAQGLVPYGVQTGDEDTWDNYAPAIELAEERANTHMANDIVSRLRYKQLIQEPWFAHKEPLFGEAADEIERLREVGDALAQGIRTGQWDDALDAWTELRA